MERVFVSQGSEQIIFLCLGSCLFKANEIAFQVSSPHGWLVLVLSAYRNILSLLLKSKASPTENELENRRFILNYYAHEDTWA
uniref:Uncharacterized protein n=1 Tax=Microcebus murinus TaxID=30608 RepID=A0A8C5YG04_MICMU